MAAYVNITKHVVNWANVDMLINKYIDKNNGKTAVPERSGAKSVLVSICVTSSVSS